jgi:hypothetical protein
MARPFDPNSFLLDNGQYLSGQSQQGQSPLAMKELGVQQNRLRGTQVANEDFNRAYQGGNPGFGPLPRAAGPLPDSNWDAYFGLLQARENSANQSGRNFNFDERSWGNPKALDIPTGRTYDQSPVGYGYGEGGKIGYNPNLRELAPGQRGRPNAYTAAIQGLNPNQGGYYNEDEYNSMNSGGVNTLQPSIQRALEALFGRR